MQAVVEEVLVKKPFVKVFAVGLLEGSSLVRTVSEPMFDLPMLAVECLKNMSAEDLRHLHFEHKDVMAAFETHYTEIQGNTLENELAKIMSRYIKEGKPQASPQIK